MKEGILDWLSLNIGSIELFGAKLYLFGSLTRDTTNFNDCDIAVVTNLKPNQKKWEALKLSLLKFKKRFEDFHCISFSISIFTVGEWTEAETFLSGKKIKIDENLTKRVRGITNAANLRRFSE